MLNRGHAMISSVLHGLLGRTGLVAGGGRAGGAMLVAPRLQELLIEAAAGRLLRSQPFQAQLFNGLGKDTDEPESSSELAQSSASEM